MRRVPLWLAIVIEISLIFVALSGGGDGWVVNPEIWVPITVNAIFIIWSLVRKD